MRLLLASACLVGLLAGCTGAVGGSGSGSAPRTAAPPSTPSAPPSAAPPSSVHAPGLPAPGTPSSAPTGAPAVPIGTEHVTLPDGSTLTLSRWAQDRITDCDLHSYGRIVAWFEQHPCRSAHRVLWTFPYRARTVALAVEDVTAAAGPAGDLHRYAGQLVQLERADGTGSVDDLLREGHAIPGATAIPADEVFRVIAEDNGVSIVDAWYLDGTTRDQDPDLYRLEGELFLTPATPFD